MTNNKGPQVRLAWGTRRSSARAGTKNSVKADAEQDTEPKALQTAFFNKETGR